MRTKQEKLTIVKLSAETVAISTKKDENEDKDVELSSTKLRRKEERKNPSANFRWGSTKRREGVTYTPSRSGTIVPCTM